MDQDLNDIDNELKDNFDILNATYKIISDRIIASEDGTDGETNEERRKLNRQLRNLLTESIYDIEGFCIELFSNKINKL
jgi:hypothetical protein